MLWTNSISGCETGSFRHLRLFRSIMGSSSTTIAAFVFLLSLSTSRSQGSSLCHFQTSTSRPCKSGVTQSCQALHSATTALSNSPPIRSSNNIWSLFKTRLFFPWHSYQPFPRRDHSPTRISITPPYGNNACMVLIQNHNQPSAPSCCACVCVCVRESSSCRPVKLKWRMEKDRAFKIQQSREGGQVNREA